MVYVLKILTNPKIHAKLKKYFVYRSTYTIFVALTLKSGEK
jgi:hypothetical protein